MTQASQGLSGQFLLTSISRNFCFLIEGNRLRSPTDRDERFRWPCFRACLSLGFALRDLPSVVVSATAGLDELSDDCWLTALTCFVSAAPEGAAVLLEAAEVDEVSASRSLGSWFCLVVAAALEGP
jgi:hypothetical protein